MIETTTLRSCEVTFVLLQKPFANWSSDDHSGNALITKHNFKSAMEKLVSDLVDLLYSRTQTSDHCATASIEIGRGMERQSDDQAGARDLPFM